MRWIASVDLFCLVALAACGGANPAAQQASPAEQETSPPAQQAYQAFVEQLRAEGASVVENQKQYTSFFSGEAHYLIVNDNEVAVYAYPTPEEASADAAHITSDGSTFHQGNTAIIYEWASPPHFYKKDTLIVLYVGVDNQLCALLTRLLGPQFAGWS